MSAQTAYRFGTPMGAAGGIVDLAPYAIDTFLNEEDTGVMDFGVAVVKGTAPNKIKKAAAGATAAKLVGVTTNNRTTEYDLEGEVYLRKGKAVGVMRYGRIYVRVVPETVIAIDDPAYVSTAAETAGMFTNSSSGTVAIKGRFLSTVDATTGVAMVELFNQAQA